MSGKEFKLTPAHEKFCLKYVDTGNATGSYLFAFPKAKYSTAREQGSRLLKINEIQERIKVLQEEYRIRYDFDKDKTIRDLIDAAEEAKSIGQFQAYSKLREMVIKMKGFYEPDKIEHSGNIELNIKTPGIELNNDNEETEE